ncbi:hypothetical protein IAU60_005053 [Kwoniella sp. DSM 27419]
MVASEILSTIWSSTQVGLVGRSRLIMIGVFGCDPGPRLWLLRKEAPCMVFNNATSLPLLLISSLGKNGTLDPLIGKDELDDVLDRAQVYLLINALVCNLTRFTFGPSKLDFETSLITGMMKNHPLDVSHPWSHSESPHPIKKIVNATQGYPDVRPYGDDDEQAPLLAKVKRGGRRTKRVLRIMGSTFAGFMNPPMYGGLAAVVFGVIPFTHRWLFEKGLSESIEKIGKLYAALQMLVIGAHLSSKKGSRPPAWTLVYLFVFRFLVMPVISVSVVYGMRKAVGGKILADPVLIVEIVETAVAKTIVISYGLTPLISGSVTVALQVVQKLY